MLTITRPPDRREPAGEDDQAEGMARRREAALRLPPLECGCRDPETWEHLTGGCRFRGGDAA